MGELYRCGLLLGCDPLPLLLFRPPALAVPFRVRGPFSSGWLLPYPSGCCSTRGCCLALRVQLRPSRPALCFGGRFGGGCRLSLPDSAPILAQIDPRCGGPVDLPDTGSVATASRSPPPPVGMPPPPSKFVTACSVSFPLPWGFLRWCSAVFLGSSALFRLSSVTQVAARATSWSRFEAPLLCTVPQV